MTEYTDHYALTSVDTDGDGIMDAEVYTDPATGASIMIADVDGDGVVDTQAVDVDGDGQFEEVGVDNDGDGLIDAVGTDTDGDGVADSWHMDDGAQPAPELQSPEQQSPELQTPDFAWPVEDGSTDSSSTPTADPGQVTTPLDLDGDGADDSALITDAASGVSVLVSDTDGDGVIDTGLADTDADGTYDTGAVDVDADGELDAIGIDTDGNGEIDTWEPVEGSSEPVAEPVDELVAEPVDELVAEPVAEPVDGPVAEPAADADRTTMEAQFWQAQTENGFCGPTSVAIILAEVYGVDVDAQEMVDRTIDNGWLIGSPGDWDGMKIDDTESLMESYGVQATTITPADAGEAWTLLEQLCTDENYGVIAYIDSSEVWDQVDDDLDESLVMDHAVVVTHVDADYVYLNDPGTPDGQQLRVDRDKFMDAWDDSGHTALVTDEPAPSAAGPQTATSALPGDGPTVPNATGTESAGTAGSPLDLAALDGAGSDPAPWGASPDVDLLTAVLPGLRVALLPVVLGAGALVAVAARRRRPA